MKLYITSHSPFARMARIMVLETGLNQRVEEIVAQVRVPESPYYEINPSGRVPYLVRDEGVGLEESELICTYLDTVAGTSFTAWPADEDLWEHYRMYALARSFTDGVSVWFREILRPETDRSAAIIDHERQRAARLADVWEREIGCAQMQGPLNLTQITLGCCLGLEDWVSDFNWRDEHPKLVAWMDQTGARPSFLATGRPSASYGAKTVRR